MDSSNATTTGRYGARLRRPLAAGILGALLLATAAGCNAPRPVTHDSGRAAGHPVSDTPSASATAAPSSTATTRSDGTQVVTIETTQHMRFQPDTVRVRPGRILLRIHNSGTMPHQFGIDGIAGTDVPIIQGGETEQVSFTAGRAGTFTMVCAWHKAEGMTGTFVVDAAAGSR